MNQQLPNMYFPMYNAPEVLSPVWVQWNVRISQTIAKAWVDANFKKKLISAPKEVLADNGLYFPEVTDVVVKENANTYQIETSPAGDLLKYVIPLPSKPNANELLETWATGHPASPGAALMGAVLMAAQDAKSNDILMGAQNASLMAGNNAILMGAEHGAGKANLMAAANSALMGCVNENAALMGEEATRRSASALMGQQAGGATRAASALMGEANESASAEEEKPKRSAPKTRKKK